MGTYIPNTPEERLAMMQAVGISEMSQLYEAVPQEMMVEKLNLPEGKSEMEVARLVSEMAAKNKVFKHIYRGAGAYHHYIPSIVKQITSKEEFVTTYTPYQAEVSQGVLQSIFEYQTMIAELTGMDISNASVYDGATAAAEAITCCIERKRTKMLVSGAANPDTLEVMKTYSFGADRELVIVPTKDGVTDLEKLAELIDEETAGVFIQQPNFFGMIEDAEKVGEIAHNAGAKFVMGVEPISAFVLKSPAECGADIVTGEGQSLGIPLSFGGPYLGFMAATEKLMRRLPGRIVGETVDVDGRRAFVLTLQAREQHIRREKATSNICSNQALCAMMSAVYMATLGPVGMEKVAMNSYANAHYAAEKIAEVPGFELVNKGEFFNEFVTKCADVKNVLAKLEEQDILGGLPVCVDADGDSTNAMHGLTDLVDAPEKANAMLWCFTETASKEDIDTLVSILKEVA